MCSVGFTHKAQERPRAAKGNGKLGKLGKGNLGARKHALSGSEWEWKISGPPKGVTNRAIHCAWEAEKKGFQRQFGPVLSLMRMLWGEYDWFRTTRAQVSEPLNQNHASDSGARKWDLWTRSCCNDQPFYGKSVWGRGPELPLDRQNWQESSES